MTATTPAAEHRPGRRSLGSLLAGNALIIALLVIIAVFSVLRPTTFPTLGNFGSILQANAAIAFVALGLLIPLILGRFDLSVAATAAFSGMMVARLMSDGLVTVWPLALLLVLAACAVIGLINGLLVAYVRLHSLVVTLGVQSVLYGGVLFYSKGMVIYDGLTPGFLALGQSRPLQIPLPFLFVVVVAVILWFVLYYRPLGRRLYAIGGSEDAARLTGIKVNPMIVGAFVASSLLAGTGGFLQVAQVGSASPGNGGEFLLPAIAACFLGETSIRRGFYNVWGTVVAVYLVAVGTTGLFMIGVAAWVQPVFNGLVLVGAITAARFTGQRVGRSARRAPAGSAPPTTPTEPAGNARAHSPV
ncbi:ABC transporter permease [Pseudonocardia yuanmonensis]|uniref:ABC transporter permease n=1 Tax=Pseudonocardia yuanmonensis TaxID=1095914 RepID=A0ABP8W9T4_9PSEU